MKKFVSFFLQKNYTSYLKKVQCIISLSCRRLTNIKLSRIIPHLLLPLSYFRIFSRLRAPRNFILSNTKNNFSLVELRRVIGIVKKSLIDKAFYFLAVAIYLLVIISIINTLLNLLSSLLHIILRAENFDLYKIIVKMFEGKVDNNVPMGPVRWWPSGVLQSAAIIGSALVTFRMLGRSLPPRQRLFAALGAAVVAASTITYHSALENSVEFNRFIYGWVEYRKTGNWPSLDLIAKSNTDEEVKTSIEPLVTAQKSPIANSGNIGDAKSYVGDSNYNSIVDYLDAIFITLSEKSGIGNTILDFFKPVPVNGYLDDLLGQQLIIYFCLFILTICTILFIILLLWNLFLLSKKDTIISFLDKWFSISKKKYLMLYINYQILLIRISLIVLPILILFSLSVLAHGLHYLITHNIPLENLPLSNEGLHIFLDSDTPDLLKTNLSSTISPSTSSNTTIPH